MEELIEQIVEGALNAGEGVRTLPFGREAYKRSMYYNLFVLSDAETENFDPWCTVKENPVEHLHELGPTATLIADYRKWQISERYGLSFIEWCQLPKYIADMICEDSKRETEASNDRIKQIEQEEARKAKEAERLGR